VHGLSNAVATRAHLRVHRADYDRTHPVENNHKSQECSGYDDLIENNVGGWRCWRVGAMLYRECSSASASPAPAYKHRGWHSEAGAREIGNHSLRSRSRGIRGGYLEKAVSPWWTIHTDFIRFTTTRWRSFRATAVIVLVTHAVTQLVISVARRSRCTQGSIRTTDALAAIFVPCTPESEVS